MTVPIEVSEVRRTMRALLGESGWPRLVVGLGYARALRRRTPRRPVEKTLM